MNKKRIRGIMSEKRDSLALLDYQEKSKKIKENLFNKSFFKDSRNIFTFISFKSEVDTHNIIKESLNLGKKVSVPLTLPKTKEMLPVIIKSFEDLKPGTYGILEPDNNTNQIKLDNIDLVLVPGLAFDPQGYRVGYGGGYYDRFFKKLSKNTIKVGLAFDFQIIDKCPTNKFDLPVDYILTESNFIKIK